MAAVGMLLLAQGALAEQEPAPHTLPSAAPRASDPLAPVRVGPREAVGKESAGSKAVKGVLGGLLGGSSSKTKYSGPKTRRDPTRKQDYALDSNSSLDIETGARARWDDDGLLVSSRIEESDDKGTFQHVFLQNCSGQRMFPAAMEIYQLWTEQSFSVSWSKTSTVNGNVVNTETGGWSDSRSSDWHGPLNAAGELDGPPAIWQQAGYGRAHAGVRQVGTTFALSPGSLDTNGLLLVQQVTRPEQDPVVTAGFGFVLRPSASSELVVIPSEQALASGIGALQDWQNACGDRADIGEPDADPQAGDGIGAKAGVPETEPGSATSAAGRGKTPEDRRTEAVPAGVAGAGKPPCEEALLSIEKKKSVFLAKMDDPTRLLAAAMQAAADLGNATRNAGIANAQLAAEQSILDSMQEALDSWDTWFEEREQQREKSRLKNNGGREPSWAKGSGARSRKRHQEQTAELREQTAQQQQAVNQAQQAASAAAQAQQAAQGRFDAAMDAFGRALAALKNAKDDFAELVVMNFRCSPCKAIASHWASAARLKDLLQQLQDMIDQAQARVTAQLQQAQQKAAAATAAAQQVQAELESLEQRRSQIEQEMKDAVDTSSGCFSFAPQEGWGFMNLASMDGTRGTVYSEGAAMAWRSSFKGSDVRVWVKPGCLKQQIEDVNWKKVNQLNSELVDLQSKLEAASQAAAEAQRAAGLAQAAVDGLQAQLDALSELEQVLRRSGLEENTDQVLKRLDELSKDCAQEMKKAVRETGDYRKRQREADGRIAGGTARRDALRRRAGKAADELDDMNPGGGDEEDEESYDDLKAKADELADKSGDEPPPAPAGRPSPSPDSVTQADEQRNKAKKAAEDAEAEADEIEDEVDVLGDEVSDLEDAIDRLRQRLQEWRRYHAAVSAFEDCLRKKKAAVEELAEMDEANANVLKELAKILGDAADEIAEAGDAVGEFGGVSEAAEKANEKAGKLAETLNRLGNAMEIIDAVMRADDLTPSEKLEAMSKAFEELRQWLPELPGVTQMLEFYNEAMKAIAGKLAEIEKKLTRQWADLVEAGIARPEDAPIGIREEVRKAAKIRELMRIISRNCGKPPVPPQTVLMD